MMTLNQSIIPMHDHDGISSIHNLDITQLLQSNCQQDVTGEQIIKIKKGRRRQTLRKASFRDKLMIVVLNNMPLLTNKCIIILLLATNLLSILVQSANLDLQQRQTNQVHQLQLSINGDGSNNENNNNKNANNNIKKSNVIASKSQHEHTASDTLLLVTNQNPQNDAYQQPLAGLSYPLTETTGHRHNDELQLQILPFSLYLPTNQASLLQSSASSPDSILIAANQPNCDSLHQQQCISNNNNQPSPTPVTLLSNEDLEEAFSNNQDSSSGYNQDDTDLTVLSGGRYNNKRPSKPNNVWNMRQLDRRGLCMLRLPSSSASSSSSLNSVQSSTSSSTLSSITDNLGPNAGVNGASVGVSSNDNFDIDIYLFNRNYPDYSGYNYLEKYNQDIGVKELKQSRFDPTIPTYIIIHGFRGSWAGKPWQKDIKDLILAQINANVLIVDWSQGSKPAFEYDYPRAVVNSHRTGQMMALFARKLINATQIDPQNFHIIGYSLGAHIAGYIGQAVPNVARITALDPTGVCYEEEDHERKLTRDDATTVVAIHTNGRTLGTKSNVADYDVFINGGMNQPGCSRPSTEIIKLLTFRDHSFACSHRRAHLLVAERLGFCMIVAYQCSSYEAFKFGECGYCDKNNNQCVLANLIEQLPIHSWFSLYKQQGFTPDDSAIDSNINTKPTTTDKISSQMKSKNENEQTNKYNKKQRENVRWSIDHSKQFHVLTSKASPYCSFHYQIIIETNRRWRDESKRPVFNVELIASIDSNNEGGEHMNEQITVGAQSKFQSVNVKVSHFVTNTYAIDNLSKRRQYVSITANGALSSPSIMSQRLVADGPVVGVPIPTPAQKNSLNGQPVNIILNQQQQQPSSEGSASSESGPTATAGSYSEDIMTALVLIESSDQAFQYMPLRFSQANVSCNQQEALDSVKRVTINYMSHSNYRIRGEYSSRLCPMVVNSASSSINLNSGNQMSTGAGGGQQQSVVLTQTSSDQSPMVGNNKRSSQIINNNNDGTSGPSGINQQASPASSPNVSNQSSGGKSNFLSSIFNIGNKSSMKFLSVSSSNKNKILSTRLFTSDSLC